MKRINIIGTSGSGKSAFAKRLSYKLNIPYLEMDALYWGKNWEEPTNEVFFEKLEETLKQESWVLDGNYSRTNHLKWERVDTIIWIDFSFFRTIYQATRRATLRAYTQEELWVGTGNRESLAKLFSHDSILMWTLITFRKNRKRYSLLMKNSISTNIRYVRLRNPKACQHFLNNL